MGLIRGFLVILISLSLIIQNSNNAVEGRYHSHKKQNKGSPVSSSPVPSPDNSPTVPSDPYPNDPGTSTSGCIFDVMSYGAVGDGSADDTAAFREAWKAACAVESGVVLAPSNYYFKITSTIFSGPCKSGLVFQVSFFFFFPLLNFNFYPFQNTVWLVKLETFFIVKTGRWGFDATWWAWRVAKSR